MYVYVYVYLCAGKKHNCKYTIDESERQVKHAVKAKRFRCHPKCIKIKD